MYRLVKMSVNPAGRFGAPETEPGPCGVGKVVEEELMTISIRNDLTDSCEAGMVILGQPSESDRWSRDRATIVVVDGTCFRLCMPGSASLNR
jgi:hypothetical protein